MAILHGKQGLLCDNIIFTTDLDIFGFNQGFRV